MAIHTDEDFKQFSEYCSAWSEHDGSCSHPRKVTSTCLEKKYCPRMAKPAVKAKALWRENTPDGFAFYLADHNHALDLLIVDSLWKGSMLTAFPNIDVVASLRKASSYWATELGWSKKKSRPANKIDWKATYSRALGMSFNQVESEHGARVSAKKELVL